MDRGDERRAEIDYHQVSLASRFDGPQIVTLVDQVGSVPAGHGQNLFGLENRGVQSVDFLEQHRRLAGLEHVLPVIATRPVSG